MATKRQAARAKPGAAMSHLEAEVEKAAVRALLAKHQVRAAKAALKEARKSSKAAKKAARQARKNLEAAQSAREPATAPPKRRPTQKPPRSAGDVARSVIKRLAEAKHDEETPLVETPAGPLAT